MKFCIFANYKLDQILSDINKIWDELHPPENNQAVIYSSYEAIELVETLAGKRYDMIDFNSTEYDDICVEGSSYALQYYAGGIFMSIVGTLRTILTWPRGCYAGIMFSLLLLKFIVNSEQSRGKLFDNSYVSSEKIVRIFGEIYEIACYMHDELGDEFDDFEHFNEIATILAILPK